MSMPKPVRARTWRPPLPRPAGGPRRRRSSTPGCSSWTRSHPPPASVLRESAARKVSALVWRAHIPDTHAASGPESEAWKDPDPRRRSSRGSGAQNRPVCPAMGATRRLRPVPVSTTSWRYGLRRTSRLVTGRSHRPRSAWPNQARLALLRSRTAKNGYLVFGLNNFRSPNRGAGLVPVFPGRDDYRTPSYWAWPSRLVGSLLG